jgi:prophage regulatory protein
MNASLLRLRDVLSRVPRSRSTIYAEVGRGIFPRPIKVGSGAYWRNDEIDALIDAYSAGADENALAALCEQLHVRRGSHIP